MKSLTRVSCLSDSCKTGEISASIATKTPYVVEQLRPIDAHRSTVTMSKANAFPISRVVATPAALALLNQHRLSALELLRRHSNGDFGDVCIADIEANLHAIKTGLRIVSKYRITDADAIYVITEADRSSTCLLLPSQY